MSNQNPKIIGVDFETYYDKEVSITVQGSYNYCRHPKFDAYMITIVDDCGNEYAGRPEEFDYESICKPGDIWVSHNKSFDKTVYEALVQQGKLPDVFPDEWHCSADLTAYLGYPRALDNASKFLLDEIPDKSTRDKMKGQRWEEMTPEFREEVLEYATEDSRLCRDIYKKFGHRWPQTERDYSDHTVTMGNRGVPVDVDQIDSGITLLQEQIWEAENSIPWSWDADKTPLSPKALAKQCREVGIEPPKSLAMESPECAAWEDKYGEKYPWVGAMRTWRRCNMIGKKLAAMKARVKCDDPGWMAYNQLYGGAHTLRDSGSGGVNMQNLPRVEMFGVNIREMIKAPAGFKLVVADYGQIEARVTAWLAGDKDLLELVRQGVDIYEAHARATMGYKDPKPLGKVDPDMRQLAKARVLSLGFGCGASKFRQMAETMYGLKIEESEAKRIVREYRKTTPVPKLWKQLESDVWGSTDSVYQIELPSGRSLTYRGVKRRGDEYSQVLTVAVPRGRNFIQTKTWGGKLTENLVQATARDLFVEGVLRVEAAGIPVIMRVHDEVVCLVPEADAEEAAREVERLMTVVPDWAEGLPVAADAEIMDHYKK